MSTTGTNLFGIGAERMATARFHLFFLWRRHFLSVWTVRPHGQTIRTVAESVQVVVQLHVISAHVVDVHAILGCDGVECGVTAL